MICLHPAAHALRRFSALLIVAAGANAQLSLSAYRVLGQPDLHQQGVLTDDEFAAAKQKLIAEA